MGRDGGGERSDWYRELPQDMGWRKTTMATARGLDPTKSPFILLHVFLRPIRQASPHP
jgi:hypothetical protein